MENQFYYSNCFDETLMVNHARCKNISREEFDKLLIISTNANRSTLANIRQLGNWYKDITRITSSDFLNGNHRWDDLVDFLLSFALTSAGNVTMNCGRLSHVSHAQVGLIVRAFFRFRPIF